MFSLRKSRIENQFFMIWKDDQVRYKFPFTIENGKMMINDGNLTGYVGNGNSGLLVNYLKKYKNSREWSLVQNLTRELF